MPRPADDAARSWLLILIDVQQKMDNESSENALKVIESNTAAHLAADGAYPVVLSRHHPNILCR